MVTTQTTSAFELITNRLNVLNGRHGDLTTLTTIQKANFVAAINELNALIASTQGSAISIDDANESPATVYSSQRTKAVITADIAAALEGEDLSDLAAQVVANAQADSNFISVGGLQAFTAAQQLLGRQNIGAASQADLDTANTSIATNTTGIATNASNISVNSGAHVANAAAHAANTAATAANLASINSLSAAIGDTAAYDPVASINAILTF